MRFEIPAAVMIQADREQLQMWSDRLRAMMPVYGDDPRLPLARAIENEIHRLQRSIDGI